MNTELKNVNFEFDDNLIIVKTLEKPSYEIVKSTILKVLKLCEVHNCYDILIDGTDIVRMPSSIEMFRLFMSLLKNRKVLYKMRIAYIISENARATFRFFDNLLTNRGVDFRKFNKLNDARIWLTEER